MTPSLSPEPRRRLRMEFRGAVQGVGFRPHVYRLARKLELDGWVVNDNRGVRLEVEGPGGRVREFAEILRASPPRNARVVSAEEWSLEATGLEGFHIRESDGAGIPRVAILPDLALCRACREDVLRPDGRRHGYAFTNCTDCGPRFSIVRKLPYDRPNTTMAGFRQCQACLEEYGSPGDRRFHAQPNACPECGPSLAWIEPRSGTVAPHGDEACLDAAADALRRGRIVAVKGLGGFHLVVDAANDDAVNRLRRRKAREAKPLAVMVPDLAAAESLVELTPAAREILASPQAPIVLLPRVAGACVAPSVAPGNPRIGVMLPYTPLHLLLLTRFGGPVVATSGNRSDEPICTDEDEALVRLGPIADAFLIHDRPIQRHVDDSVVVLSAGHPRVLRRGRGYAPFPLVTATPVPPLLAVGGHLKNTVAVARDDQIYLSQHIGDLETEEAQDAFERAIHDLLRLYRVHPRAVVHDLHPDYASTRWVRDRVDPDLPRVGVQHHHAHLASVLAEHDAAPDDTALGVVWDGIGYGSDNTVWGGEFLVGGLLDVQRSGHLRTFQLPGGESAVREPRRSALGLLMAAGMLGEPGTEAVVNAFTREELRVLERATARGLNAPVTSSAGRLFDALSALLDLCQRSRYEGEGAMALEFVADPDERGAYPLQMGRDQEDGLVLDWEPLVRAVLAEVAAGTSRPVVAARIHNGLADGIARMATALQVETVALSGGCFQNQLLLDRTHRLLDRQGHRVLINRQVPPGDGGISLGQIAVAASRIAAGPTLVPDEPRTGHRERPSSPGV